MTALRRLLVRTAMRAAARVARWLPWRAGDGVIGVVLTPDGRIVLVRHTYVDGWYPPGGGRKRGETPERTVLRELREEIGLQSWTNLEPFETSEEHVEAFIIRDAFYHFKPSLEIEESAEFELERLPSDVSPRLKGIISAMPPRSESTR